MTCTKTSQPSIRHAEGIRIWGYLGPFGIVRHNDIRGFTYGVHWHYSVKPAADSSGPRLPWMICDNYMPGSTSPVVVDAGATLNNISNNSTTPAMT